MRHLIKHSSAGLSVWLPRISVYCQNIIKMLVVVVNVAVVVPTNVSTSQANQLSSFHVLSVLIFVCLVPEKDQP